MLTAVSEYYHTYFLLLPYVFPMSGLFPAFIAQTSCRLKGLFDIG